MRIAFRLLLCVALSSPALQSDRASAQDKEPFGPSQNKFVGIGIQSKREHGALVVMTVLPFSPAQRAGLRPGDRITAVEGRSVAERSTDQTAKAFQGKEGSFVSVTAVTAGQQPRQVRIRRELIEARRFHSPAAAQAHIMAAARRQEALMARVQGPLREALRRDVEFMSTIGELTSAQRESLRADAEKAIERLVARVSVEREGGVRRFIVDVNGQRELRAEYVDTTEQVARQLLTPLLKTISPDASEKVDAECGRVRQRSKQAEVLAQIAAFDEALLLTREQREMLVSLLGARWTDVWRGHLTDRTATDPISLCRSAVGAMDLFTIPDVELKAILTSSQVATFKLVQLPTREVSVFVQDGQQPAARRFVRRGLPLEEERLRLKLLLERLVDDAAAHGGLGEEQKQKLLTAGKLDLDAYFKRQAALEEKPADGRAVIVPHEQIAGVKARLPTIFADADSTFQRIFQKRLSSEQRAKIAEADRERGRFHRQAVLGVLIVALAERALLTDNQAGRLQTRLADSLPESDNAQDLAGWRQATLKKLRQLRPEAIGPLLDDWQRPAAREYLTELADSALIDIEGAP
ncbi:MAG TPA: PDZ domain-containing protein [Pirellulales bacterium]|nr:PDZ domain-containing protein [Pirellulales bacterium]